jgi:GLPGLI family protein
MKFLFVFVLLFITELIFAQVTAGSITYSMFVDSDEEEVELQEANALIERTRFELVFTKNQTRTSVKIGDDVSMTTIIDSDNKKGLILVTGMMGNLAISTNHEELTNSNHKNDVEIEFFDQTKVIQGYNCKKARIVTATGTTITYWYTNEILFNTSGIENMYASIPGVPLEYRIESDGVSVFYTAVSIKTTIVNLESLFSTNPPDGYTPLTMAQFEAGQF